MCEILKITSIAVILTSCIHCSPFGGYKTYKTDYDLFTAAAQDTVITLERLSCFGECPSYRLAIFGNGTVIFEGRANVKERKRIISKIDETKLDKLIAAFKEANYFDYVNGDSLYRNCNILTSSPRIIITSFKFNGRFNYIEHNHAYFKITSEEKSETPPELQKLEDLENLIDEIVNTKRWTERK